MPFKVTDFGTNRKPIYDFLLVNNTNLPPNSYLALFPKYC